MATKKVLTIEELYIKAINAFDRLILDHGYSFKELDILAKRMIHEGKSFAYIYKYFINLRLSAYELKTRIKRDTSALEELIKSYLNTYHLKNGIDPVDLDCEIKIARIIISKNTSNKKTLARVNKKNRSKTAAKKARFNTSQESKQCLLFQI